MLSHILPAARDHAGVFKVFDTFLAAASVIPIFCYILFIFLFTRAELIELLPHRFQTISKLFLLVFIPIIVTLNELSSFVGVSLRAIIMNSRPVIAIGFTTNKDKTLWTFLTSLTLAFLAVYQAINFSLAFYRLVRAILNKRRIETTSSDEAHLLNGIGWITGGLKLGAIETVIGFAANGFGSAITRRIMRLLSRASLVIGLIKGSDTAEDFTHLEEELSGVRRKDFRRSRLLQFVSNPRYSTFRQLTPTATAFHSTPSAPQGLSRPSPLSRSSSGLAGMEQFAQMREVSSPGKRTLLGGPARERVTIHFENGTPSLQMRFSTLEIPDLPLPVFDRNPATVSRWTEDSHFTSPQSSTIRAPSSHEPPSLNYTPDLKTRQDPYARGLTSSESATFTSNLRLHNPSNVYIPPTMAARMHSAHSTKSTMDSYTSLSTVRDLAAQFPALPTRALELTDKSSLSLRKSTNFWDDSASAVHAPAEPNPPTTTIEPHTPTAAKRLISKTSKASESSATTPTTVLSDYMSTPVTHSATTTLTNDSYLDFESALGSGKSRAFIRDSDGIAHPADWIDFGAIPGAGRLPPVVEEEGERQERTLSRHSRKSGSMGTLRISWLNNPDAEEEAQLTRAVSLKKHAARIKSVGKAPMRSTPRPINPLRARGSLHIEHIQIPVKEDSNVEIIQGSLDSSYGRSMLRDSDVLGASY
ncbi:hypothetical protein DXG01_002833 [Tephrocybe rancida]|nr:hypothetical protein DXG01_002833 [Tephrocybe rancida]